MKTTLKALALVTAAGVSGITNAATPTWVDGTTPFNNTFTASGTVLGKEFSQKWQWAVGPGLPNLQGALSQAQASNGNKVTITIPQNTPILVGKTKEAFAVQLSGGVGAIPNIAFTDKGKPVKIIGGPAGYIDVDVYNSSDSKIGSAKLNLTAAAIASQKYSDPKKSVDLYSIFADLPGKIFYGGLSPNAEATYLSGRDALDVVTIFGGLSLDDVKSQLGVNSISVITTRRINEDMAYGIGDKVSASYALGFKAGQTIDVTFDANNKPTSTTQWTASLGIQVTYV